MSRAFIFKRALELQNERDRLWKENEELRKKLADPKVAAKTLIDAWVPENDTQKQYPGGVSLLRDLHKILRGT